MLVKETISFDRAYSNDVHCVFLNASQTYKIEYLYDKNVSFDCNIPFIFIRSVLYEMAFTQMYILYKEWCRARSELFCKQIDGLLELADTLVGCYIGRHFLGALTNACDDVLLTQTPACNEDLLSVREEFAKHVYILFKVGQ
jgi:hypothetical protein